MWTLDDDEPLPLYSLLLPKQFSIMKRPARQPASHNSLQKKLNKQISPKKKSDPIEDASDDPTNDVDNDPIEDVSSQEDDSSYKK